MTKRLKAKPYDVAKETAELKARICPHCHVALLYPHPEYHGQLKCHFCGFARLATPRAATY